MLFPRVHRFDGKKAETTAHSIHVVNKHTANLNCFLAKSHRPVVFNYPKYLICIIIYMFLMTKLTQDKFAFYIFLVCISIRF